MGSSESLWNVRVNLTPNPFLMWRDQQTLCGIGAQKSKASENKDWIHAQKDLEPSKRLSCEMLAYQFDPVPLPT